MSGPGGHGTVSFFICLLHVTRNWLQHVSQSRSHSGHFVHQLHVFAFCAVRICFRVIVDLTLDNRSKFITSLNKNKAIVIKIVRTFCA